MAAEVVAAVINDVELMKASQIGMKAIGAGLAVGLTGLASGVSLKWQ